ncbi:fructose-6-phosphate aldolase [Candidatus Sordicultor fermentans]|uniref:fructose-6-phosphate aldolase n=1 Tax=Candidatus Sordicultor fermentans TaxID=1953203 RepID=UPI0016A89FE5|nr:fructose-6-phosphate aldolase [Atribacterota bacterium]NLY06159.1 fructose-6-phosphate aldolase [Candidatus Atribacteria bacterium]MDY0134729.1 fructose-6-phosphate aldolase [Atribacterota bacterium]HOA99451.1 fructose-6-phosphate aldolase [Candidatus Atribacteria bacterium]HOQ51540.1 fructose-6-phosphate aldolase [Candidatus Atribacteria bacterium]
MKFFIDTADTGEIKEALKLGVLDGVTTNPTLVSKTGRGFREVIMEICSLVPGPVSAEVVSLQAEGMIKEGRELSSWAPNIVVKVPITTEGLKAIKALSQEGVSVNTTLIFNPLQALMAAKAGATYVSPFVGRLDDISSDGMRLVADILQIFRNYDITTQVIVASIRHPMHVVEAARLGAHVATIPFPVISKLIKHPLTDVGIDQFLADWEKVPEKPF